MSYRELKIGARPGVVDFHGKRTATRVFRSDYSDPVSAQTEIDTIEGGVNSPYPGDPGLIVDSVGHSDVEGACVDITYNYSSDRRASLPPRVNKDRQNYYQFNESDTTAEVDAPYAKYIPTTMPANAGDVPIKRRMWTIFNDYKVVEPRTLMSINVTINGWSLDKRLLVRQQNSKIHTINGQKLLFKGLELHQRTDSTAGAALYDGTYSWLDDPGTDAIDQADYDIHQFAYPTGPRKPYEKYVGIPSDNPSDQTFGFPTFFSVPNFRAIPDGWRTLPGIPNL